jgi:hypothetical protein
MTDATPNSEYDNPQLWTAAASELSPEERKYVELDGSPGLDVLNEILAATETKKNECLEKRWRYVNKKGEVVVIRDLMDKLLAWVEKFKKIGDIAVQIDPVHAVLPWAAIRFLLQVVVSDSQAFGSVLEGIETIAHLINRYAIFEKLYLSEDSTATPPLRKAMVRLYASVLRYLAKAKRLYSMNSAKRFAKSIVRTPENDFQTRLEAIKREEIHVERYARLIDAELQRDSHSTLRTSTAKQNGHAQWQGMLAELEEPIRRVSVHLTLLHDNLQTSKRREILSWISTIPYEQHHANMRKDRLERSGLWLLSKLEYTVWRKSSTSSILWLHGIPGSGKSKLASLVVDQYLGPKGSGKVHEPFAYFYCARNPAEPERSEPIHIFRGLLRQLSCVNPGLPIMAPVAAKYKGREESNYGISALELDECIELILELGKIYPSMTIIIDALDECSQETRFDLLESLDIIIQQSVNLVKVFVTSREDSDIGCKLDTSPNMYISALDNHEDIQRFVTVEVDRSIKSKKLLRGNVSNELKELVVSTLVDKARGM